MQRSRASNNKQAPEVEANSADTEYSASGKRNEQFKNF